MQVDILDKKYRFVDGYVIPFSQEDDYECVNQKSAWSEEDEELLTDAIKYLEIFDAQGIHGNRAVPLINWLKSLKERVKPQNTWKPSKEQLHYLSWIANIKLGDSVVEQEVSKHLNELLEDLKKLREE
jgi:hypothetical protein